MRETRAETNYRGDMTATVARMHARYGRRLTRENYTQLISCSNVSDAAGYLKHSTCYADDLAGVDTAAIHRGYLEDVLRRKYYENYFRLGRYEKIVNEEFYNYLTIKTEIDEILMCILHINAGTDDHIATLPIYMNRYTCFDLNELAGVRTFDGLLSLMKKTPYYQMLLPFRPAKDRMVDHRACELCLRTYFFTRILSAADDLGDKELADFIRSRADVINIINAYRLKKHFGADRDTIASMMIPINGRISERRMNELYNAADEREYVQLLSKTVYGRDAVKAEVDLNDLPAAMTYISYTNTKRTFAMTESVALSFYTYHMLKETELNNMIKVIEGIRYKLPAAEIMGMIITEQ